MTADAIWKWDEVKVLEAMIKADPAGWKRMRLEEIRAARPKRNNKPQTLASTERALEALRARQLVFRVQNDAGDHFYTHDALESRKAVIAQRQARTTKALAQKGLLRQRPHKRQRISPLGS